MNTFRQFMETGDKTGSSFFPMELISSIEKMELGDAKDKLRQAVNSSSAKDENKRKGRAMIDRAASVTSLMTGAANFLLAHPENDLGMSKGES